MKVRLFFIFVLTLMFELYANTLQEMANKAANAGKLDNAIYLYNKALEQGGNKAIIYFNLGNIYFKKTNIASAVKYYEDVIKLAPFFKDSYLNLGKIHYLYENYTESLSIFLAYHERDEKNYETIMLIGDVYKKINLFSEAEEFYEKAIALDRKNDEAYIAKAYLYSDLGDVKTALEFIREGLFNIPDSLTMREIEADFLKELGMYREAAAVYQSIINNTKELKDDEVYRMYYQMADAFLIGKYVNLSISTLHKCIKLFPDKQKAVEYLGYIYTANDRYTEALEYYISVFKRFKALSYLGIKKVFIYAYNNDDQSLIEKIIEFYDENNIKDELYDIVTHSGG